MHPFIHHVAFGKIHKFPFPSTLNEYPAPLHLLHIDLWCSLSLTQVVTDIIYILQMTIPNLPGYTQKQIRSISNLCNFKTQVELQLGSRIKNIQSDRGGELRAFIGFLKTNGIHHRVSCLGADQQNGTSKRKHRHIVENGLELLAQD